MRVKSGLADMLKGGVIMDVTNAEQAKIAEEAGACAVMALERVPSDIRAQGGVVRMADPTKIKEIQECVSIPVMAKARIGHFVEAQILESLEVDYIDESEVLTPADEANHINKWKFKVPFVCGAVNLGEALRRISEGASMMRTKGEAGTGDVVEAVRHMRTIMGEIRRLSTLDPDELYVAAKQLPAPYELVRWVAENRKLPVVNFSAGGIATPADAARMMQLGAEGVFVGSGIFKSEDPQKRANAIVKATTNYRDAKIIAEADGDLGDDLGVAVVGRRLDDGVGALLRILALEDAGADKDALRAELHHEGGVGGRGDAAGAEVDHRELAILGHPADQLVGRRQLLGGDVQLVRIERGEAADLAHDGAHVTHGLDDVAGAGLALGAHHRGAFADAAQGLTEVHGAADEGHLELPLVDVVGLVGGREDLALVDVVDLEGLEDLGFDEVADARLGHDGDGDALLDLLDLSGVGHADHAALGADVGGHALEGHDGAGPGLFGDLGLLGVGDVHDDAALEHVGEAALHAHGAAIKHGNLRWFVVPILPQPRDGPLAPAAPQNTQDAGRMWTKWRPASALVGLFLVGLGLLDDLLRQVRRDFFVAQDLHGVVAAPAGHRREIGRVAQHLGQRHVGGDRVGMPARRHAEHSAAP